MISTYNDKKEKHQSWEAHIADTHPGGEVLGGACQGYGATEEEAVADLLAQHAAWLAREMAVDLTPVAERASRYAAA